MAKKVLILSSSPRRGGNSDTLCDEFMRGAVESGNHVEKIFLRDKTIHLVLDAASVACIKNRVHKKMMRLRLSERCWRLMSLLWQLLSISMQ